MHYCIWTSYILHYTYIIIPFIVYSKCSKIILKNIGGKRNLAEKDEYEDFRVNKWNECRYIPQIEKTIINLAWLTVLSS